MERGRRNKRVVWVPHMWVKKIDREFPTVRSPVDSASRVTIRPREADLVELSCPPGGRPPAVIGQCELRLVPAVCRLRPRLFRCPHSPTPRPRPGRWWSPSRWGSLPRSSSMLVLFFPPASFWSLRRRRYVLVLSHGEKGSGERLAALQLLVVLED